MTESQWIIGDSGGMSGSGDFDGSGCVVDGKYLNSKPRRAWSFLLLFYEAACNINILNTSCNVHPSYYHTFGDLRGNVRTIIESNARCFGMQTFRNHII